MLPSSFRCCGHVDSPFIILIYIHWCRSCHSFVGTDNEETGVGKTAVAEGLAQISIDPTKCPARLQGHRIVSLEMASLVAGTKYQGYFDERLQAILKEVMDEKSSPTILFIGEVHNLLDADEGRRWDIHGCGQFSQT